MFGTTQIPAESKTIVAPSTVEYADRWRVRAHCGEDEPTYFHADNAAHAGSILRSLSGKWTSAMVLRPDGFEPRRGTFLTIYGETDFDRAQRDLRYSPRFGECVTERPSARCLDDLIDIVDGYFDPSQGSLQDYAYALRHALERGDVDAEDIDQAEVLLDDARDEWLSLMLKRRGFDVETEWPIEHQCAMRLVAMSPWPTAPGVYFVRAGDRIKIGKAKNVASRLRELQTSAPVKLELLAVAPGGLPEEASYHQRFAQWRVHGEWFEASDELVRCIAGIQAAASSPRQSQEDPR